MAKEAQGNKNISVVGGGKTAAPVKPFNSDGMRTINGHAEVSDAVKNTIFGITGTDKNDVLNKVASQLNGSRGSGLTGNRTNQSINVGNYELSISTRKVKGQQTVTHFMVWDKNDRLSIRNYFRG